MQQQQLPRTEDIGSQTQQPDLLVDLSSPVPPTQSQPIVNDIPQSMPAAPANTSTEFGVDNTQFATPPVSMDTGRETLTSFPTIPENQPLESQQFKSQPMESHHHGPRPYENLRQPMFIPIPDVPSADTTSGTENIRSIPETIPETIGGQNQSMMPSTMGTTALPGEMSTMDTNRTTPPPPAPPLPKTSFGQQSAFGQPSSFGQRGAFSSRPTYTTEEPIPLGTLGSDQNVPTYMPPTQRDVRDVTHEIEQKLSEIPPRVPVTYPTEHLEQGLQQSQPVVPQLPSKEMAATLPPSASMPGEETKGFIRTIPVSDDDSLIRAKIRSEQDESSRPTYQNTQI